ncbi:probable serine/threonine-protein kinase DDB_G0278509 isoform X2 [Pseudomyrmex gracilis]|nr:probable serine/threonine-protein kinase DDB_G0278509 isoform X2 [Pseudomyrmex gracilis]XP_020291830.1 probable serine/threonine-protein kinase DDB_G0278509 isoform X2 [Pseudomyrmex gracilis]XP_020291831.1 probable serine/threonine-protein kinase DDB_G0278509 isoform X2 [Pseudomyrmex gracilis]XP_020291832.1 probable serine/threonine-protein kinase DDB_G0278509 isoform X2 [Pseudomyrmex gracilis]XP_020291833.1 probable serine/threonine-protein kinase DDB_G0278509 isoform X2 [Pseudomyrmex graci
MSARLLKDPATASSRIFVGHLQTDDVTKLELEEHFSKYGNVIASIINRGFGFVQFEDEHAAQNAIKNEDGAMFKGRRIDVRPAKKDNQSNSGNAGNASMKQMSGPNNQFNPTNVPFSNTSDTFGGNKGNFSSGNASFNMNQDFGNNDNFGNNQLKDMNPQTKSGGNFDDGNQLGSEQFNGKQNNNNNNNNNHNNGNDHFNNPMQPRNQFNLGNLNRGNDQFAVGHQNRGPPNNQFGNNNQLGNQNRLGGGGNQNRNQNNAGNNNQNQNSGAPGAQGGGGGPPHRTRGSRGGRNRNKNNQNNQNMNNNNFRDRSPINRNNRIEDKVNPRDWELKQGDSRLRGNTFARDSFGDSGNRFDDFKASTTRDTNTSFGNASATSDYLGAAAEKNDCEIIVVNKALTKYAEEIELRLKQIGLLVDLLFPNEDVPLGRVLGNIASRGCLYAVVVTPINHEHHSLTLNILHGLPQEHRNMPVEDAINLISRDFANYKAGGSRSIPLNTPLANERHPDAIQVLLNILADNHQLTVLQYDRVIKYLEMRREEQVQVELGDVKDLPVTTPLAPPNDPKQAELQTRILNILNNSKTSSSATSDPSPVPPPVSAPAPVPPATWGTASSTATTSSMTNSTTGVSPSPLLNDPTVQKALDSLLQGNLLKSIGDQQQPAPGGAQPLFAAFPNIGRF